MESAYELDAESLAPLEKTRGFGMTLSGKWQRSGWDLARVLSKSYEAAFEASVRCTGKTTANVVPFPSVLETSIRP